ncbi:hypothetical protein [Thermococcus peptonophilus]|uniref:hypothetical protein n=1 Tax=Thermococcus peptonophilus TaxID=53952 RepID=UPI000B320A4E|nr:hypothetical protein [Thermococcus peptonophilus]
MPKYNYLYQCILEEKITEKRKRPINIFLLNKGRALDMLTAIMVNKKIAFAGL